MWDYSQKVQDYFVHPHNAGPLADANAIGEVGSIACGDALKLYLKISDDGTIEKATFETFGCASAIASSSVLTDMVIGMKVDDALKITNADIAKALDGLPREKMHCSVMGQEALEAAIRQWKGEPAMPRTQEEGKLVCKCFNVTDKTIIRAIRENHLKTVEDVTAFTKAGGGCGECRDEIAEILEAELKKEGETFEQPVKQACEQKPAGLSNLQRMQKVMEVINMIRPQLQADGGDIELVDINGKVVSVRLQGSCHGCAASQVTLHQVIEQILRQQVEPDIVIEEAQK